MLYNLCVCYEYFITHKYVLIMFEILLIWQKLLFKFIFIIIHLIKYSKVFMNTFSTFSITFMHFYKYFKVILYVNI